MELPTFDDKLEVLGVIAGAYLLFTVVGMVLGQSWSTTGNSLAAIVQIVGILATAAIGVLLILVVQGRDIGDLVSRAR